MAKWGFWEWVAYAVLFIAAVILAADQGIKLAPDLATTVGGVLNSPFWAFAPLVLILVATAILVAREFNWIGPRSKPDAFTFKNETPRIIIASKQFRNERIPLDGRAYRDCTFTNVTLVYNGTAPAEISGCHGEGIFMSSENPAVISTIYMLEGVGFFREDLERIFPPGTRVERPKRL